MNTNAIFWGCDHSWRVRDQTACTPVVAVIGMHPGPRCWMFFPHAPAFAYRAEPRRYFADTHADNTGMSLGALLCCLLSAQLAALQTVSSSDSAAMNGIPSDVVLTAAVNFPPGSVTKMESNIKAALNGDTKSISMLRTLKLFLERMGADKQQVMGLSYNTPLGIQQARV